MPILTRCVGKIIVIELPDGERIEVAVPGVKVHLVRIGTDVLNNIIILRDELTGRFGSSFPSPLNTAV